MVILMMQNSIQLKKAIQLNSSEFMKDTNSDQKENRGAKADYNQEDRAVDLIN